MNFKNQHKNLLCQICGLFPECQSHLLQCPQIAPKHKLNLVCEEKLPDKNQIFESIDDQLRIVKIYMQIMELRKEILDEKEDLQSWLSRLADACGLPYVQQLQYRKL